MLKKIPSTIIAIVLIILVIVAIYFLLGFNKKDIKIIYGEKGEYGETVVEGSNIVYKLPEGTYNVHLSAMSEANVGFITIRDSNTSNYNIIDEYKFDFNDNNSHQITIKNGQYIHITVNTIFNFYED